MFTRFEIKTEEFKTLAQEVVALGIELEIYSSEYESQLKEVESFLKTIEHNEHLQEDLKDWTDTLIDLKSDLRGSLAEYDNNKPVYDYESYGDTFVQMTV